MAQPSRRTTQPSRKGGARAGVGVLMDPDSELAHLTKELNLTADQQAQIKPLLVEHRNRNRRSTRITRFRLRNCAPKHIISNQTHKKIEAFLTDEQKQKVKPCRRACIAVTRTVRCPLRRLRPSRKPRCSVWQLPQISAREM